jgi:hypothetical protein
MGWDVDLFGPDEAAPEPQRPKAEAKPAQAVKKKNRMARSDLLVALVKAGATGDRHLARTSAEALIADEKANKHTILAERLTAALRTNLNGSHVAAPTPAEPAVRGTSTRDLFVDRVPQRRLSELLLPAVTRDACEELIEEQRRADVLRSHGLEPRHRILLAGPLRLDLPAPGERQIANFISMYFQARPVPGDLGRSPDQLARALRGSSLAEVEDFCTNILRRFVLSLGEGRPSEIVEHELRVWRSRVSAPGKKKSERRGGETPPSDT